MKADTKRITTYSMLVALALILSWVEAQVPAFLAVPGMKLGLTNVVVLVALYLLGNRDAIVINLLRILLVAILFGSMISFAYSAAGGLLAGIVMILLKRTGKFGIIAVSIAGGVAHNVGQILIAMAMLETRSLAWYLLVLWIAGLVSGALIGLLGGILCRRLEQIIQKRTEKHMSEIGDRR